MEDMNINSVKAKVLTAALPYIQKYNGKTVVVKYGGNAMVHPLLKKAVMSDIILLRFVNGLRYTDEETIEIVQMVLSGKTNKDLVSLIEQLGGTAIGMCGIDAGMIQAKKLEGDYGYVGDITHINTEPIENAIANGYIPVIATVGTDLDGNVYNINADTAAAEIATALQAENIITLTDIRGLLQDVDDPDSLISTVTMDDIPTLMERGIISGGMIPKIKGLEAAIKAGVKKAVMIDGRIEHSILIEIFSDEGIGTMFTK